MINKYISRFTSSDRGEPYNILTWPFLLSTLAYGLGFSVFRGSSGVVQSSLHTSMISLGDPWLPVLWGIVCIVTIIIGVSYLLFRTPPFGRISGLLGFMVWVFAVFCWMQTGGWLLIFAVGIPNIYFWAWQYFSLSKFKRETNVDKHTMAMYDAGLYDDEKHAAQGKIDREDNRGVDRQ